MSYTRDLTPNLRNSLQLLYQTHPTESMKCVEIGSYEGGGSVVIHDILCNHPNSILYCIDPFDDIYVKGKPEMSFWDEPCKGQYGRFKTNTQHLSKIVELKGTSDVMIPTLEENSLDFAYIDGDHSPEQVYKDIVNVFPKMKKNSIVLFDDYLWEMNGIVTKPGVDKFLEEYKGSYELLFQNWQLALRKL